MAGRAITLTEDPELLDTDEKLVANEYIAENFEWTTLQEVADEFEIPLEELEYMRRFIHIVEAQALMLL